MDNTIMNILSYALAVTGNLFFLYGVYMLATAHRWSHPNDRIYSGRKAVMISVVLFVLCAFIADASLVWFFVPILTFLVVAVAFIVMLITFWLARIVEKHARARENAFTKNLNNERLTEKSDDVSYKICFEQYLPKPYYCVYCDHNDNKGNVYILRRIRKLDMDKIKDSIKWYESIRDFLSEQNIQIWGSGLRITDRKVLDHKWNCFYTLMVNGEKQEICSEESWTGRIPNEIDVWKYFPYKELEKIRDKGCEGESHG